MSPQPAGNARPKLGAGAWVVAGLSFIPLVGVVFGVAAIVWGMATRKAGRLRLALVGAGGIAFTVVIYGGLIYFGFVQRGGIYDNLRAQLARGQLYTLVQAVEFYRLQYGAYPDSLQQLQSTLPKQVPVMTFDPTEFGFTRPPRYFYYERVGADHYYLRSVGPDGQPFTADDILPDVTIAPNSKVGLLLDKPSR
jgi:type II secretory pathway pseudopilin PulG